MILVTVGDTNILYTGFGLRGKVWIDYNMAIANNFNTGMAKKSVFSLRGR